MAYKDLREFIEILEKDGDLIRIKQYVNPELEITEIADRISKQYGPALLFENTGTDFPVLINSMGTYKRMCTALGVKDMDEPQHRIMDLFKNLSAPKKGIMDKLKMLPQLGEIASWMPKIVSGKGACQEVINLDPDITKFPVLKCWPEDGGPFITLPIIHTKDPHTGIRNVGMYRMQVFEPKLTGMHWHKHKVSARHYNEYKELGQKMPVAVALGGDPVYTYAATAPLPDNIDEYMLAGFLRKKKVELVQCITQDIQVPADAEIIIEGYVDPAEDWIWEGPFGDHTGYYSLADWYPRFHITAITHRKDAIYPTTIVGIPPQEDAWIGKATERIFLAPIKMTMVPEIIDMVLPMEGVFHNLVIVKIKKDFPGQAQKVMNALWGAGQMMFTKMMIVVDGDVNIHDNAAVAKYISENTNPMTDLVFNQGPTDVLDHSCSTMAFGGKMGIDATHKLEEELASLDEAYKEQNMDYKTFKTQSSALLALYPEIKDFNGVLLEMGISVLFVSVEKNKKGHIKALAKQLHENEAIKAVKLVIVLEHTVDVQDIADSVWRFSNNVDPKRDHIIVENTVFMDGTRKTLEHDNFKRDWPNILANTPEVIEKIDAIWPTLGLGEFIPSPSRKYLPQVYEGGAVAR